MSTKPKYHRGNLSPKGKVIAIYKLGGGYHYRIAGHKTLIKEKDIDNN